MMAPRTSDTAHVRRLGQSFRRVLIAENKSARTIETYCEGVEQLADFLEKAGMPIAVGDVRREHVEAFTTSLLERFKPATASNRYRALRVFFKWLVEEGEIAESPMERMKPPKVPEVPVPVLTEKQLHALLRTCEGREFEDRRDMAILRLLIDTGMRRGELASLKVSDIDFDLSVALVLGKGRRPRACPFGRKSAVALDRYLRARGAHKFASSNALWLGQRAPLSDNGVLQIVRKRGKQAGIEGLHPHVLRHSFASAWLSEGGNETDLMQLAGWQSREMLNRYGASAAAGRARAAHKRLSLGDRL